MRLLTSKVPILLGSNHVDDPLQTWRHPLDRKSSDTGCSKKIFSRKSAFSINLALTGKAVYSRQIGHHLTSSPVLSLSHSRPRPHSCSLAFSLSCYLVLFLTLSHVISISHSLSHSVCYFQSLSRFDSVSLTFTYALCVWLCPIFFIFMQHPTIHCDKNELVSNLFLGFIFNFGKKQKQEEWRFSEKKNFRSE